MRRANLAIAKDTYSNTTHPKAKILKKLQNLNENYSKKTTSIENYARIKRAKQHHHIRQKHSDKKNKFIRIMGVALLLIIIGFFFFGGALTGLVIEGNQNTFTESLNKEFTNTTDFIWNPLNPGEIDSIKMSGEHIESGEIKIFIEDKLVYEYKKTTSSSALTGQVTGEGVSESKILNFFRKIFGITGKVTEDTTSSTSDSPSSSSSSSDSPSSSSSSTDSSSSSSPSPSTSSSSSSSSATSSSESTSNSGSSSTPTSSSSPDSSPTSPSNTESQSSSSPSSDSAQTNSPSDSQTGEEASTKPEVSPSQETTSPVDEPTSEATSADSQPEETPTIETPIEETPTTSESSTSTPTSGEEVVNETEVSPSLNETSPEVVENTTKIPKEENITSTEPKEKTATIEKPTTKETTPTKEEFLINFTEFCKETCQTQLNKSNYTIRIEIKNSKLNLKEIIYTLKSKTTENITQVFGNETAIIENVTIQTIQQPARIGEPVVWEKIIKTNDTKTLEVGIPKDAESIVVEDSDAKEIPFSLIEPKEETKKGIFGSLTGQVTKKDSQKNTSTQNKEKKVKVKKDKNKDYKISYETPAPYVEEKELKNKKIVKVIGPETTHYQNIETFTKLNESLNITDKTKIRIHWIENNSYISPTKIEDTNLNGIYDYIEWVTPHLSNQTFEIILITKAQHLDENKSFISNIYKEVKELDNKWSEEIKENEFIRVTFEKQLDDTKDITLYPRIISGNPTIEVYEENKNIKLAEFTNIKEGKNQILLTELKSLQNTFDLKIIGGSLEIDYIIDPLYSMQIGTWTDTTGTFDATPTLNTWTGIPFNNEVSANPEFTQNANNIDVNLATGGKYLVLYNILITSDYNNRLGWETKLTLAGADVPGSFSSCYIRNTGNDDAICNAGSIINANAGDDIRAELVYRTSFGDQVATMVANKASLQIIKLDDDLDYIRLGKTTNQQQTTINTWTGFTWETEFEKDTGSFSHAANSNTIGLQPGHYLMSVGSAWTTSSSGRSTMEMRTTLDGTPSPYGNAYRFTRGSNDHVENNPWVLTILDVTSPTNLIVEYTDTQIETALTSNTNEASIGLQMMRLPETANFYRAYANTARDPTGNSATPTKFDMIDIEDESDAAFTGNGATGDIAIQSGYEGNYLFAFAGTGTRTSTANVRSIPYLEWYKDGTSMNLGGMGDYVRGSQGSYDSFALGLSGAIIAENSGTSTYSLWGSSLGQLSAQDQLTANEYGITAVRLDDLVSTPPVYPQFTTLTESPNDPATYNPATTHQFQATITNTNTTAGIEFNGVNYSATNVGDLYTVTRTSQQTGTYNYYWWSFGNDANEYENKTTTQSYTINKATPTITLNIDGSESNKTILKDATINIACSQTTGDSGATLTIYREGSQISQGTTPQNSLETFSTEGIENITCIYTTSQNYLSSSKTFWVNVTSPAEPLPLFSNFKESPSDPAIHSQGADYQFNSTIINTNGTTGIEFNGINYSLMKFGDEYTKSFTDLAPGIYNYYFWAYGNNTDENFTQSTPLTYTINKGISSVALTLNGSSSNITFDQFTTINLACYQTTGRIGETLTLYKDNIPINQGMSPISNQSYFPTPGLINITCAYPESQNYSSSFQTFWITVNAIPSAAPTTPTNITCNGGTCNRTINTQVTLNASGAIDVNKDLINYSIEANIKSSTTHLTQSLTDLQTTGGVATDSTPKTCSGQWGWDCGTGPPETGGDNTWDTCSTGSNNDESVEQIYLNVTSVAAGDPIEVTCEFDPYTSSDSSYISYYDGVGWTTVFKHINWGSASIINETATFTANSTLGTHWIRCGIEYVSSENTGPCWTGGSYYDNDDISFEVVAGGASATEKNSTENILQDLGANKGTLSGAEVTIQVDSYNPESSIVETTNKPDLYLEVFDGTGWVTIGNLNLPSKYTGNGLQTTKRNFTTTITNPTVLTAWQNKVNQDIRIKGVSLDYTDATTIDEITYENVWIKLSEKSWTYIGNHSETNTFLWNTTLIEEQNCIDLRTRAIDPDGTNTYSAYFTKNSCLNISRALVNTAPTITNIYPITDVSFGPNEAPLKTPVTIKFEAEDLDGYDNLVDGTATLQISKSGETTRFASCSKAEFSGNLANYTCNLDMWWWDGAGNWDISAHIEDVIGESANDNSATIAVGQTTGFLVSNSDLTWAQITPGATNQEANEVIVVSNTGNAQKGLEINATNLYGTIDNSRALYATDFKVGPNAGCSGTILSHHVFTQIIGTTLPTGNYSIGDGTGQEELYVCLFQSNSNLTTQDYTTNQDGDWILKIFAVLLTVAKAKRKKKKKEKLTKALGLILSEIKDNNLLDKNELLSLMEDDSEIKIPVEIFTKELGALESMTKYLKENLKLTYVEISKLLNRNQKTIWTAYNKSLKKSNSPINIVVENSTKTIPIEIFMSGDLTVLESTISHLRKENMKYSEIGKLLNRNERNIWTINNRMKKKLAN